MRPKPKTIIDLARLGGSAKSAVKAAAARENGEKGGRPPKSGKAPRHFSSSDTTAETAKRLFAFLAHRGSPAEFVAAHPAVNARQVDAILSAARFSLLNKAPGWTWIPEERPTSLFAHYLKAGDYGPEQEG